MTLTITFNVETDIQATDSEIREWVDFSLKYNGQMKSANPLAIIDLEAQHRPEIRRGLAFVQ